MTTVSKGGVVKVLLIDDDPVEAKLLRAFLESRFGQDFEMVHVWDLADALAMLDGRDFDHVLLDNRLPPFADYRETLPVLRGHATAPEPIIVSASVRDRCFEAEETESHGDPAVVDKFALRGAIAAGLLG